MFKLVQNLFKYVQMCSNVFKHVQTCSRLVQMCSNLLKCVQTCSKLVQMCSNGFKFVQNCFKWVQMCSNVFKWVNPNNWGKNYHPFQCKGSDMTSRAWSSFLCKMPWQESLLIIRKKWSHILLWRLIPVAQPW